MNGLAVIFGDAAGTHHAYIGDFAERIEGDFENGLEIRVIDAVTGAAVNRVEAQEKSVRPQRVNFLVHEGQIFGDILLMRKGVAFLPRPDDRAVGIVRGVVAFFGQIGGLYKGVGVAFFKDLTSGVGRLGKQGWGEV